MSCTSYCSRWNSDFSSNKHSQSWLITLTSFGSGFLHTKQKPWLYDDDEICKGTYRELKMHALAAPVWVTKTFNHRFLIASYYQQHGSLTLFRHLWWLLLQRTAVSSTFTKNNCAIWSETDQLGVFYQKRALLLQRTHLFCFPSILFKQKWYILTFHHIHLMFWLNKFNMIYQYYIFENIFNFILIVFNHIH